MVKGFCYICGSLKDEQALRQHIKRRHSHIGEEKCLFVKAESALDPEQYWLYFDVPLSATLGDIDAFLRRIWVECCGHMSSFYINHTEIGMKRRISEFQPGEKLRYEYDFGQTTELNVIFLNEALRPLQPEPIRLIGRNQPPVYSCASCGSDAAYVCTECMWDKENPYYCGDCVGEDAIHMTEELIYPITNSPRCGICSYSGEKDIWPAPDFLRSN